MKGYAFLTVNSSYLDNSLGALLKNRSAYFSLKWKYAFVNSSCTATNAS
ncbi:hypothetical protein [Winogradskyella vincentii]|uniref:Uncharacterized protein n=1 Tax=Winogradskyella vincentii TaxID=2877122 RepID=A0ABS7XZM0_9FLAO|nr:hypothetical protein [Winogradskyella vincentii]MCA0153098.1 hypothetical protein [Winogradskyella vincentii]